MTRSVFDEQGDALLFDEMHTTLQREVIRRQLLASDGQWDVEAGAAFDVDDDAEMTMPREAIRLQALPETGGYAFGNLRSGQGKQDTDAIPEVVEEEREEVTKTARVTDYVARIRALIASSGVYALSSLTSPLVSLLLAPFLTRYLSHTSYGALAVLNTVIVLIAGVTQFGLDWALLRAYCYNYETKSDRKQVISTVVVLIMTFSVPFTLLAMLFSPWLSTLLLGDAGFSTEVKVAAGIILMQNLSMPGLLWLRAENRAAYFSILSIMNLLLSASANIVLVGVFHLGLLGALLAVGSGYALIVLCTLPIILARAGLRLRWDMARVMLAFGLPCVVNLGSGWILQLSDRYLLGRLGSLSEAASYAVAYSLGGVLGTAVLTPFTMAWQTPMYTIAKREDAPRFFQLVFRWFSLFLLLAAFGLSLLSMGLLYLFFPVSYYHAAPIIPVIALSIMFYGVYGMFMNGVFIQGKTWYAVVLTTTAAVTNVALNIFLIPRYGSIGAALATLIAYVLLCILGYILNQRIYPVPYEVGLFLLGLVIGLALYIGGSLLVPQPRSLLGLGVGSVAFVLYALCLGGLGLLRTWQLRQRQAEEDMPVEKNFPVTTPHP